MNILNNIILNKKGEVAHAKKEVSLESLQDSIYYHTPCISLAQYISRKDKSGIIAEFKHRSPSRPAINLAASPIQVSQAYAAAGASAISVLTDSHFFGGSKQDLREVRAHNHIPILRKDFIIDSYQIHEAKSWGADAILLIAQVLSKDDIQSFTQIAQCLGLEVLLEIHDIKHLDKIDPNVDVLGINNRNLDTFECSIQHSIDIYQHLPSEVVKISESGIRSAADIQLLRDAGYLGFLIGEQFMKEQDPGLACKEFIQKISVI